MGGHDTRELCIYTGRQQSSQSRWTGNPSEARWRRQLLTTLTHNRYILGRGNRLGLGSRRTFLGIRWAVTQNEANTDTCLVSGGRRGSIVLAGERKGSSSHSGEWRGSGVLSGASSLLDLTLADLGRAAPGRDSCIYSYRGKTPKPLLSCLSRPSLRGARALKIT